MEHLQQSNDLLTFFGTIVSVLLVVIGYFLRETMKDLKTTQAKLVEWVSGHETRITVIEKELETAA